jgi:hypothetical protein
MAADAGEQHDPADQDDDQGKDGGDLPAPPTGIAWHGLHLTRFPFGGESFSLLSGTETVVPSNEKPEVPRRGISPRPDRGASRIPP